MVKRKILQKSQVPEQRIGSEMNALHKISLKNVDQALHFFNIVKTRLLDVNNWTKIAGNLSQFQLCDEQGQPVHRLAKQGDYIRINIPGPGTHTGDGYDWVRIENITLTAGDQQEILSMRARPAPNPTSLNDDTAHFLTDEATSTFQVKRFGAVITAEEHARNEVPNVDLDNNTDKIRNSIVGWAAKLGLSYPQWKALVKGLLAQNYTKQHN